MELLNKYQSRAFQFALELLAILRTGTDLEESEINALALQCGLDYGGQVLEPLCAAGLVARDGRAFRLAEDFPPPELPVSRLEKQYLAWALEEPEAPLFLSPELRAELAEFCGGAGPLALPERCAPLGAPPPEIGRQDFTALLTAIRQGRLISYTYCTKRDDTPHTAVTLPWKLEYSAFDRRWWAILYHPEERRTIKAQLHRLQHIRLLGPAGIDREEIRRAMDDLLEPEPAVLEVRRTLGALERCFLVFEHQLFEETRQVDDSHFRLTFRFYRFDRSELLRRLLYLGPAVTLLEPPSLRRELLELVEQALEP